MDFGLRQIDPLHEPDWDTLVQTHPGATFFHSRGWAATLRDTYGFSPVYFATFDSGRLLGLLAAMDVRSSLTGRRGVSLPFSDACEPLVSDSVPLQSLFDQFTATGKARRWKYWECRGLRHLPGGTAPSLSFFGHSLELSGGEQAQSERCKPPVRRAIRKAEQAGVQVESSNTLEAVRVFYQLHCLTRRKHGLPPQPFRFFEALHRHVLARGAGEVYTARIGERPIAANLYVQFGANAIYKYGASDPACQELRASNLVMWRAILAQARRGCRALHFGRTSLAATGLRRFKLGWGCREESIDYLRYDYGKEDFIPIKDEAHGAHNAVMRRLPGPLLRALGAVLYRHMG